MKYIFIYVGLSIWILIGFAIISQPKERNIEEIIISSEIFVTGNCNNKEKFVQDCLREEQANEKACEEIFPEICQKYEEGVFSVFALGGSLYTSSPLNILEHEKEQ